MCGGEGLRLFDAPIHTVEIGEQEEVVAVPGTALFCALEEPNGGRLIDRIVTKFAAVTGLQRLAASRPSEYGLFVELVAR